MQKNHVQDFFDAMSRKDLAEIEAHLAEDIVLLSPVFPTPFEGRAATLEILAGLLRTVDSLKVNLTFASDRDIAVFFTINCDGVTVKGNEHIHVDDTGRIDLIEVAWRPLPAVVLLQQRLAKTLGGQPLQLVPVGQHAD